MRRYSDHKPHCILVFLFLREGEKEGAGSGVGGAAGGGDGETQNPKQDPGSELTWGLNSRAVRS